MIFSSNVGPFECLSGNLLGGLVTSLMRLGHILAGLAHERSEFSCSLAWRGELKGDGKKVSSEGHVPLSNPKEWSSCCAGKPFSTAPLFGSNKGSDVYVMPSPTPICTKPHTMAPAQ